MEGTEFANKYKNKIINIAVILLALIISGNIYRGQSAEMRLLEKGKAEELKKNEVLERIGRLEDKIKAYQKILMKKDAGSIMNTLTKIGSATGVEIASIKPEEEQKSADYCLAPFSMTVKARDFHSLGNFVSKIENDSDKYTIEILEVSPASQIGKKEGRLTVNLLVHSAYLINKN